MKKLVDSICVKHIGDTGRGGSGNTRVTQNSKTIRKRNWVLTVNNYTNEDIDTLNTITLPDQYFYGFEISKSGTEHLQAFVMWKNAKTFEQMKKKFPKAHIEVMRGTKRENMNYCKKEGNFETNIIEVEPIIDYFKVEKWRLWGWQVDIVDLINEEPDYRKIYWYWDDVGNTGKSAFSRYLIINRGALAVSGCSNDIKYGVSDWIIEKKLPFKILIIDIPRSEVCNISYKAIEQIKNGFFYSTKYKSGMVVFNIPHVIVFANSVPDYSALSEDRLVVKRISNE